MSVKIIIDTDIGSDVDDAIAIAFAVRRPELDIKAITTVYGPTDKRVRLLAKLLHVLLVELLPTIAIDGCGSSSVRHHAFPLLGFLDSAEGSRSS